MKRIEESMCSLRMGCNYHVYDLSSRRNFVHLGDSLEGEI
jgi:hypothetical protein